MSLPGSDYETSTRRVVAFGTTTFAGAMLCTVAVFQILEGISAISKDKVYAVTPHYAYQFDLTSWGWIHVVIGAIALATGIGILLGQTWGRVTGIVIAVVSAVVNFMWLPYYPVWATVILAFNGLVIWALCTQISHDDMM
jgi:hypothetical protein